MVAKFVIQEKRRLFEGKYLSVWETQFLDKKGNKKHWEWVERHNAVSMFPITRDQKVVLIKNYRVPVERYVIEMPAGLIDKENEGELGTARRELLEETGYRANNFTPIRSRATNAGSACNLLFTYIATDLEKVVERVEGEDTEDLEVIEVPFDGLMDFYKNLPEDVLFSLDILGVWCMVKHQGIQG